MSNSIAGGGFKPPPFESNKIPEGIKSILTSEEEEEEEEWIPIISSKCYFPIKIFFSTIKSLSLHPERNSSLILRADILPFNSTDKNKDKTFILRDSNDKLELFEELNVKLLPKQPRRDSKIDQNILFYRSNTESIEEDEIKGKTKEHGLVITIPQIKFENEIPFYHPKVKKLAYHYESIIPEEKFNKSETNKLKEEESELQKEEEVKGIISIHYLPFKNSEISKLNENLETLSIEEEEQNLIPDPELIPRSKKIRKRSPLAGPSIEIDSKKNNEIINPPAIILNQNADIPINVKKDKNGRIASEGFERLFRTSLSLLETIHRHGYGQLVGYQKRRIHDVIVPRDNFQDLYLILKDRHRQLDSRAPKQGGLSKLEDVKRHVWKRQSLLSTPDDNSLPTKVDLSEWGEQDIAIAAFLMLLWKDMYPPLPLSEVVSKNEEIQEEIREWDTWGRPEGGFIDLGCGNGLLVHILISEGYNGKGYELRSRRTWPLYPLKTQEALIELPIDPPSWFPDTIEEWQSGIWPNKPKDLIGENSFLIGNHADELTPWIPLLSLLPSIPVPYLSLPCCLHSLDSHFDILDFIAPEHPHSPKGGFENGLEPGISRYQSYLIWLGWFGLKCGWYWEKEGLRVPSTKGWGIVARKRWTTNEENKECREWALEQVNEVKRKGAFKVREKEGKDHL
ncbi:uncharacterized protein I206_107625 [Kwoniella pini CBS 10737]|uniref:tRNA (uracil-O(2)-)-methyltransferase n=1 Tax=Kwoniella pini CBS 10737 TaxID=1296096 RepID=A0A1B9HXW6_9TREE|nr:uncharacterized protein I206_05958 [Kwoniella pini CBS 10737]OCF48091.1 hypothetical protein I206_05958 [Kwoniella pini CBS 10737]